MKPEYSFFDATDYASSLKCTIHKSGKVGFSDFTQRKLGITETMSIKIGIDGKKDSFHNLLFQFLPTNEGTAFKVNKAGNYYYINPKPLLDDLGINYKNKSLLYEMILLDGEQHIYKLIKKEVKVDEDT